MLVEKQRKCEGVEVVWWVDLVCVFESGEGWHVPLFIRQRRPCWRQSFLGACLFHWRLRYECLQRAGNKKNAKNKEKARETRREERGRTKRRMQEQAQFHI